MAVQTHRRKVSIVLPCYNEEKNVPLIYQAIKTHMPDGYTRELIFVNDASTDGTLEEIRAISLQDPSVEFVSFSRNFGHQNALRAGLDVASGDCVITMDADLQHPPSLIPELLKHWRLHNDVVYTIRGEDGTLPMGKRITARLFYQIINTLTGLHIVPGSADFRLLDRKVVNALKQHTEQFVFYRGLIASLGFKQLGIKYQPGQRKFGKTNYTLSRMFAFALDGITSFSIIPLRISVFFGLISAGAAFAYGIYALVMYFATNLTVPGWTSAVLAILFIGGVQLVMIGIMGEYLGKMFFEVKRRPPYIVSETSFSKKIETIIGIPGPVNETSPSVLVEGKS